MRDQSGTGGRPRIYQDVPLGVRAERLIASLGNGHRIPAMLYGLPVLLGSLLVFFVQPMMGRFLVPWFGGSSAVWSVALLFFQAGLLAGYAYAHGLGRLAPRLQVSLHGALLVIAWSTLSLAPDASWRPEPGSDPTWRALEILLARVGLPYAILASTAPLVQRWFDLARKGRSPYGLYALSNVGALLGLLGYPLAERFVSRSTQAALWSTGFALFGVAALAAGAHLWCSASTAGRGSAVEGPAPRTGWRPGWIVLPAVSSAMLLAVTDRMGENVPAVPFLWVLPLALFLASYVVAFREGSLHRRRLLGGVLLALMPLLGWAMYEEAVPFRLHLALYGAVLFAVCLFLHGELYRLRPEPERLTAYYLAIASGGVLGGGAVALVAPRLFDSFIELPLLLVVVGGIFLSGERARRARITLGLGLCSLLLFGGYLLWRELDHSRSAIHRSRNFYGAQAVHEVDTESELTRQRIFLNKRIVHGVQFTHPEYRRKATTYFTVSSGVGLVLRSFPQDRSLSIGVLGLGVGTLAAYGVEGDRLRFYEIDPKGIAVARELFTYLGDCQADVQVIEGDGRLSLETEAPQGFDVLVLDAFTGDAPPIHLLTVEAFRVYLRHVVEGGVLVANITNNYVDLLPVLATVGAELGLSGRWISRPEGTDGEGFLSTWVVLARDTAYFDSSGLRAVSYPLEEYAGACSLWTDERASMLEVMTW